MSIITTSYKKKQLAMLQGNQNQKDLWMKHPIKLSDAEKRTLNMGRIISVMEGNDCSPSQLAGIAVDRIASPVIRMLDRVYLEAMRNYKKKLDAAEVEDISSITANGKFRIFEKYYGFSFLWRIFGAQFISQAQHDSDARAQRFAWMIGVNVLEEQRLSAVKHHIENALDPLVKKLEDLEKRNQTDVAALTQVSQLRKVYQAHFPGVPLIQEEMVARILSDSRF